MASDKPAKKAKKIDPAPRAAKPAKKKGPARKQAAAKKQAAAPAVPLASLLTLDTAAILAEVARLDALGVTVEMKVHFDLLPTMTPQTVQAIKSFLTDNGISLTLIAICKRA